MQRLCVGASGATAAVPALAGLLDDPDPLIRASVARALGQIASDEAIQALDAHDSDQDPLRIMRSNGPWRSPVAVERTRRCPKA